MAQALELSDMSVLIEWTVLPGGPMLLNQLTSWQQVNGTHMPLIYKTAPLLPCLSKKVSVPYAAGRSF